MGPARGVRLEQTFRPRPKAPDGALPIRTLTTAVLMLALAVLALTAGYAVLHIWNRASVPTATRVSELPAPERANAIGVDLPLETVRLAAPASASTNALPRPTGAAALTLRRTGASPPALGIGIVDGKSGALLGWHELEQDESGLLALTAVPSGNHWAVLASDRATARFSYLARTPIKLAAENQQVAGSCVLDGTLYDTTVELSWPAAADRAPPIVVASLGRADDPLWSYRGHDKATMTLLETTPTGAKVVFHLGTGRYTLQFDGAEIAPEQQALLAFEVPGTQQISLRCRNR